MLASLVQRESSLSWRKCGLDRICLILAVTLLVIGCDSTSPPPQPLPALPTDSLSGGVAPPSIPPGSSLSSLPVTAPSAVPQPIVSRPWETPNIQKLQEQGIVEVASNRLRLFSDLPLEQIRDLPPLIDDFARFVEEYLGPVEGIGNSSSLPVIGYLMADQMKFEKLGLVPPEVPEHHTGWHLDRTIWMQSQESAYYQRHLLCHEYVHASLNARGLRGLPAWMEEGLAEMLATHRLQDKSAEWLILPGTTEECEDWGRIGIIQRSMRRGKHPSLEEISDWKGEEFITVEAYAWSWALCYFLSEHPRHRTAFRKQTLELAHEKTSRTQELPWSGWKPQDRAEWELFLEELDYGFDLNRWAINFTPLATTHDKESLKFTLGPTTGWQSTGIDLKAGETFRGEFSGEIAFEPRPTSWTSTPSGISIRYASGQPIGRLIARQFIVDSPTSMRFGPLIPLGTLTTWEPEYSGILFVRINDRWGDLADNSGEYQVIRHPSP